MIANTLIRRAYVLAQVIDVSDQPESYYAIEGINSLNEIIASWGSLGIYIPYESTLELPLLYNVYEYEITPVIAQLLKGNIKGGSLNAIKQVLNFADLKQFNLFRNEILGIPTQCYLSGEKIVIDEQTGELGSKLTFWPTPSQNFDCTITLKYDLDQIKITDELNQFPNYYLKPLEYQLAKDLSLRFNTELSPLFFEEYERLMQDLIASNKTDMTINTPNELINLRSFKPNRWSNYAF